MNKRWILLVSVFVVAVCGLVYELLAGTLSSYLLGDSVTHFSLVIGFFLSAMGLGSFLSKYVSKDLLGAFVRIQIVVGLLGGFSAPALFAAFTFTESYTPILLFIVIMIGTLVGFEIPLLIRIFKSEDSLKVALSNVLAVDYIGALVASLLFPLLLVPYLGLIRTSVFFGVLNVGVAFLLVYYFRDLLPSFQRLRSASLFSIAFLATLFAFAGKLTHALEDRLYDDEIIFAKTTPYQRIVLTRWRSDVRLYINGALQFSALDEYRYHESLVHPAMSLAKHPRRVLVLGGGDGLAIREILKYPSVEHIDLVDLDRQVINLFRTKPLLVALNNGSLRNAKVGITSRDAMSFLKETDEVYDVIIMDLPDPNTPSIGKLYTRSFFTLALKHLSAKGCLVTQATSPFYSKEAFWCIEDTLANSSAPGKTKVFVKPYHVNVPSFGEWGFVLASMQEESLGKVTIRVPTKYLTNDVLQSLFSFPKDLEKIPTERNELNNQHLVRYYNQNWKQWNY